jgi:hypothetical protein
VLRDGHGEKFPSSRECLIRKMRSNRSLRRKIIPRRIHRALRHARSRSLLRDLPNQTPPIHRLRRPLPRHHRWRVGLPARSTQRSAQAQRRRRHPRPFCGAPQNDSYVPVIVLFPTLRLVRREKELFQNATHNERVESVQAMFGGVGWMVVPCTVYRARRRDRPDSVQTVAVTNRVP